MSRALKQMRLVLREQKAAPACIDQPHFLFDSPCDLPAFGEHQICATPYDGHLAELKLDEWGFTPDTLHVASDELQLEPQA